MRRRNVGIESDEHISAFKELFLHLKPSRWYFEVICLLRQLMLNGVVLLFETTPVVHIYMSGAIVCVFVMLVVLLAPCARSEDNACHIGCAMALLMLFMSQLAMLPHSQVSSDGASSREMEAELLGVLVLLVFVLTVCGLILSLVFDIRAIVKVAAIAACSSSASGSDVKGGHQAPPQSYGSRPDVVDMDEDRMRDGSSSLSTVEIVPTSNAEVPKYDCPFEEGVPEVVPSSAGAVFARTVHL